MPTYGLLVPNLDFGDAYNREFWNALFDLARNRPFNLQIIASGVVSPVGDPERDSLAVIRLLDRLGLDGVVVGQNLAARLSEDDMFGLSQELPALPLVTTTVKIGDHPCVAMDNSSGLRAAIRHLIENHGCRRIAHVRGPRPNAEADARERVWRDELAAAGIEVQESWLIQGDFGNEGLIEVAQDFLAQTGGEVDAVVACNDLAAIKLIKGLVPLGVKVPQDLLVCGFDDAEVCQVFQPSLTSVHQPFTDQAQAALTLLESLGSPMAGRSDVVVPTSLVLRGSCACPQDRWSPGAFARVDDTKGRLKSIEGVMAEAEDRLSRFQWEVYHFNSFVRAVNQITDEGQLADVLASWLPRFRISRYAVLCTSPDDELAKPFPRDHRPFLPDAPSTFRILTSRPGTEGLRKGENLVWGLGTWLEAQSPAVLGVYPLAMAGRWYGLLYLELNRDSGLFERSIQEQVAALFHRLFQERRSLERLLQERTASLVLEEKMQTLRRLSSQVAHEINTPLAAIVSCQATMESSLEDWENRTQTFFTSLSPAGRELYSALRGGCPRLPLSEDRHRESRATQAAWKKRLHDRGIEDAAEFAEELWLIGFTEDMMDLDRLAAHADRSQVVRHLCLSLGLRQACTIIGVASRQATDRILALKQSASPPRFRGQLAVELLPSLEQAVDAFGTTTLRRVEVRWKSQSNPLVSGQPEDLQLVWATLLKNALQSMSYQGRLELEIRDQGDKAQVLVTDSGPGISLSIRDRVFQPFVSTKVEGEGLGMGLFVARGIVESLGGAIGFDSGPPQTTFWVTLPKD